MSKEKPIFCSLDIETSGFDPLTCEVLEVGFAFFSVGKNGVEILEEWTQVFKPTKPVPANILGLTGITQKELDEAPDFKEFKEFLQEKLGPAVIVGHNIVFDTTFLEHYGIKFSGKIIDTLDLVQVFLPTHHSYNLENLMHTFQVSHKDAHRALADSKAVLVVLEKLLRLFNSYPKELVGQVRDIAKDSGLLWAEFLDPVLSPLSLREEEKQTEKYNENLFAGIDLKAGTVFNLALGANLPENLVGYLSSAKRKEKYLLVVPKIQHVLTLWKQGMAGAQFPPDLLFNEKKFSAFCKKKDKSIDEIKFLLKILVWKYTNWQTKSTIDLNLSFFGGQFRQLISGDVLKENNEEKIVCVDMETFFAVSRAAFYKDREIVIFDLNSFEQQTGANISTKVSWSYASYLLKSIYNPELASGNISLKSQITDCLAASDLFFGLVHALLQEGRDGFQYVTVTAGLEYSQNFQKISQAAKNYCDKLLECNKKIKSEDLARMAENLQNFFAAQDNRVRWIELAENRCVFFSSPIDITQLVSSVLANYKKILFFDSLGTEKVLKYFITRLGLQKFKIVNLPLSQPKLKPGKMKQGDLFRETARQNEELEKSNGIKCFYVPKALEAESVMKVLAEKNALPAAVLFGSIMQLKAFYDQNYLSLKQSASLLVQSSTGGSNKIFRNFSINKNSLLLATDKFILRNTSGSGNSNPVEKLPVKTLVIGRLPFEQYTHPYLQAVSQKFENGFDEFSLPKAIYNFHCLIKFFLTPELEKIYVIDPKLSKEYAKYFKDYLLHIQGVSVIEPEFEEMGMIMDI